MLTQLLVLGIVNGCLYALVALGFALIYNTAHVFHVAHGATYTVAAYFCALFLGRLGWVLPVAILGALALTGLLGVLMEVLVYAPLARRGEHSMAPLLSSLGLYVVLVNLIALLFGSQQLILAGGAEVGYRAQNILLTQAQLAQVVSAAILLPGGLAWLRLSRLGRAIRAVRDNPTLAAVVGVDPGAVRRWAFGLGSVLAGWAGILAALDLGVEPQAGMSVFLTAAVAVVVGGVGAFEGAIAGSFLLGVVQAVVIWKVSARWAEVATFAVLLLALLAGPQGLFGRRRRLEEGGA